VGNFFDPRKIPEKSQKNPRKIPEKFYKNLKNPAKN